jgi:hypothetical protein
MRGHSGGGDMPIVLFDFARNLKITRFTIDVLTQRLEHLESPRDNTSEEWSRFVGLTHENVAACDHLHDALRGKLSAMQSLDTGAIAFLNAGFVELYRKIAESIARLNSFEYGATT